MGVEETAAMNRLATVDAAERRCKQSEDNDLAPVLQWVSEQRRPSWEGIGLCSRATKGTMVIVRKPATV